MNTQRFDSLLAGTLFRTAVCILLSALIFGITTNVSLAQNGQIQGTVKDGKTGDPFAGVSLVIVGTAQGSTTNSSGAYLFSSVPPGIYTVRVTLIGYAGTTAKNVVVDAGQTTILDFLLVFPIYVTEAADAGSGSLRQAIVGADISVGIDYIYFNLPGPSYTISPLSALPTITETVIIDGTTQSGYTGTPIVELDGSLAGTGTSALYIGSGGCTVRGLVINRFSQNGILIENGGSNVIAGNYVGIDHTGTVPLPNQVGIQVSNAAGNTIGGLTPEDRNIISGNDIGINIFGIDADNNKVLGNYVGTNRSGTAGIPNNNGVWITDGSDNMIGGPSDAERNIISGNNDNGVWIQGANARRNSVKGNYIGLASNGTDPLGNKGFGVKIRESSGNTVGGTAPGEGNVISANGSLSPPRHGVYIEYENSGTGNVVQGNLVGTDATGLLGRGNINFGICVLEASHNTILNNVVSDNRYGVVLWGNDAGTGSNYNTVQGNLIGTKINGTESLGNEVGLYIRKSHNNTVGGTSSGLRNIISGNKLYGLVIGRGQATNNKVQGNYIGLDINGGITPLPNGFADVNQEGAGLDIFDAPGNIIGGSDAGARNVISGNIGYGILIDKDVETTTNNFIQGNLIGTDPTGMTAVGNTFGVLIKDASANTIGGTNTGDRNIISGNTDDGINILGLSATGNVVAGNYVGIAADGVTALANGDDGINIESPNSTVGGTTAGAGNVFSANGSHGIVIVGSNATGNTVLGNYVGTDAAGTVDRGNNEGGIFIGNEASGNTIGGTTPQERNIISANGENPPPNFPSGKHGVVISGIGTTVNRVIGNYLGTDVSGSVGLGNGGDGVQIIDGASANTIGGTNPGEGNVISGNDVTGIAIFGNGTNSNNVLGNYIGLDATGTNSIGHINGTGVYIGPGATDNTVGGTVSGARNFISGNGWAGVAIEGVGTSNNVIVGNYIGTDIDGAAPFGNLVGVRIYNGASGNEVGGTATGEGNLIVHSVQEGVLIYDAASTNNSILSNSIYSNGALGIELGGDGVTSNDAGDGDTGANDLQNFPVLTSVQYANGQLTVAGSLNSTPITIFTIQFFGNPLRDPPGYGEGESLLRTIGVITDGNGNATFQQQISTSVSLGSFITATATDASNNTSELSLGISQIQAPAGYVTEVYLQGIEKPVGLAFDAKHHLLVASSTAGKIYHYQDKTTQTVIAENFTRPIDLAVDASGNLYVSDFDRGGIYAMTITEPPSQNPIDASSLQPLVPGLNGPTFLELAPNGDLFVSLTGGTTSDRIARISLPGGTETNFVTFGANLDADPQGIAFAAAGTMYLSAQLLGKVLKVTSDNSARPPIDAATLPAALTGIDSPGGIAYGTDNRLYVATKENIVVAAKSNAALSTDDSFVWTPFVTGLSGGLLNNLEFGSSEELYVADYAGGRILRIAVPHTQRAADFPLVYKLNETGHPNVTDGSEFVAMRNAFRHWEDVSTSTASFTDGGFTPLEHASMIDGVNLVTFTDDSLFLPWGVLAVVAKTLRLEPGEQTATIVDADVVFNPRHLNDLATDTYIGRFDVESIATHEIGHILGLVHSGVTNATMFFVLQPEKQARTLEPDDIAWASHNYPEPSFTSSFGSIAGTIRYGYDPTVPVAGGLLLATNKVTKVSYHSYSDEIGRYLIPGLPAGQYTVSVEPLDGNVNGYPMQPGNVSAYLNAITNITDYPFELYNQSDAAVEDPLASTPVAVSAGVPTIGIDFVTNKDVVSPNVVGIFPAGNARDVGLMTDIVVTFSEPIMASSVNSSSLTISSSSGTVAGTFLLIKSNTVAVFTPDRPLNATTTYTITATTGITDLKGNPLQTTFISTFTTTTADIVHPTVAQIVPATDSTGVFVTSSIVVRFSEPMDPATITGASFTVNLGQEPISGTITKTQQNTVATFVPSSNLVEGTRYTVRITTQATDAVGNSLAAEFSSSFTTVLGGPPEVVYFGPEDNATNVSVSTPILVDFSEPIDRRSITVETISLTIGGNPVSGSFEFLRDDSRVIFRPAADLEYGSQYQLHISKGIKDLLNEHLLDNVSSSFTTAAEPVKPILSSIEPPAGAVGAVVVIAGSGFDPDPSKNTVFFNGVAARVTAASLTSVTTTVPDGAQSGLVTVSVRGMMSTTSLPFDVLIPLVSSQDVVTANVSTQSQPKSGVVTTDGAFAYVTSAGSNSVSAIWLNVASPAVVATIPVGNTPVGIAINPTGTYAYVTNYGSSTVSVIDIIPNSNTYNRVIATISVGINPIGVAVTPDGSRIYVANYTSGTLSVIDGNPASGAYNHVVANVSTTSAPTKVSVTPDGTLAFVAVANGVLIISIDPNPQGPYKYNSIIAQVSTSSQPKDVRVSPDGAFAYITLGEGSILVVGAYPQSPSFGQVIASVTTASKPNQSAPSPDGTHLYVTNFEDNTVSVFELVYAPGAMPGIPGGISTTSVTLELVNTIQVGSGPEGIVVDPRYERIVVANSGSNNVSVITVAGLDATPLRVLNDLIGNLQTLIDDPGTSDQADAHLKKGQDNLRRAFARITSGDVKLSFDELRQAIQQLQRASTYGASVSSVIDRIVELADKMTQDALDDARAFAGRSNVNQQINSAEAELQTARTLAASGKPDDAMTHYKLVWVHAQLAIKLAQQTGQPNLKNDESVEATAQPTEFWLAPNYPNPFNSTTRITFDIPLSEVEGALVEVKIFNILGQLVDTLVNETKPPGRYTLGWNGKYYDGRAAANGIYILSFKAGNYYQARKMLLVQ